MDLPLPTQPLLSADDSRGVVSLEGEEVLSFLQGLVSNDVTQVARARAIYAALLTAQGRYLHDFFIAAAPGRALWIECEADRRQDLIRRLMLYRLRAKVRIADATEGLAVLRLFGAGALRRLGLPAEPGAARPLGGGIVFVDPRMAELGARAILPRAEVTALKEDPRFSLGPLEAYDRLRLALGVPDGSRDLEIEKALPMESGFDTLNAIDWQKGCYVGQELTARMRYRSLVKRRLIPVAIEGPAPEPGTPVLLDGAEAGVMRTARDGYGLALLRLDKLEEAGGRPFTAGAARIAPRS
ncbi:MAG: folate-binding protein [Rhodospirillales bacterium]|nr:folate-binding protein [Rhodospirillales bacterium]